MMETKVMFFLITKEFSFSFFAMSHELWARSLSLSKHRTYAFDKLRHRLLLKAHS